jgi:hypothetical protein
MCHQAVKRAKQDPEKSVYLAAAGITILFPRIGYLSLHIEFIYTRTLEQLIQLSYSSSR